MDAFIEKVTRSLFKFRYTSQLRTSVIFSYYFFPVVLNLILYNVALNYWLELTDFKDLIIIDLISVDECSGCCHPHLCVWRHSCCPLCSPGQSRVYTCTSVRNISKFPDWEGFDLLTSWIICFDLCSHMCSVVFKILPLVFNSQSPTCINAKLMLKFEDSVMLVRSSMS